MKPENNETNQKPYFFRENDGTITYYNAQEEMFALLRSPKGDNFRDMGRTDYLNLLEEEDDSR